VPVSFGLDVVLSFNALSAYYIRVKTVLLAWAALARHEEISVGWFELTTLEGALETN
jgi:hypothetical protein